MSETSRNALSNILMFAAIAEIGTGIALLVEPRIVIRLLVAGNEPLQAMPLGRVAGIAILALGVACWPTRQRAEGGSPAFWSMLIYSALIALYLAYLFTIEHLGGVLLWPAVALHVVVALLLVWARRGERGAKVTGT